MQIDLSTFETGRRYAKILASAALKLTGGDASPQSFRRLVEEAKSKGRNALFLQEVVPEEMRKLVETAPLAELELLQQSFAGDRCQRGLVFQAMLELAQNNT